MIHGILNIYKEKGYTSHDVVAKLRGALRERRVGHGGTLDPMATGVLPIFVGRATKAVEFCENAVKRYRAGLRLGIVTDTQDITGSVLSTGAADVDEGQFLSAIEGFRGSIDQVPPMYSAVKIGGQKLYHMARKGVTIERPSRRVEIYSLDLVGREGADWVLDITCSKGTYVRTLCHDIGAALGCGGVMSSLRRIAAGAFTIQDALPLPELLSRCADSGPQDILRPVDSLFADLPSVVIGTDAERDIKCGKAVAALSGYSGNCRVYSGAGEFLMLAKQENGRLCSVKNFFTT